jgi:hypothetical protein
MGCITPVDVRRNALETCRVEDEAPLIVGDLGSTRETWLWACTVGFEEVPAIDRRDSCLESDRTFE